MEITLKKTGKVNLKFSVPRIMQLRCELFGNNEKIPSKYTCDGLNINPPLQISDVPAGAESLVLIVEDPDAVTKTWTHWLVWNLDPGVKLINEDFFSREENFGTNDSGGLGYQGPCPPSGTHRYFFKVYALDKRLELPKGAKKQDVEDAMAGHVLDEADLIGLYR